MSSRQHRSSKEQGLSEQRSSNPLDHRSNGSNGSNGSNIPQKREGLLGWFQDAGDWIADKYDTASSAVTEWAGDVYESAENAIETVSETVSDAKDIWDTTSISKEDGVWNITADLDEVADLLPMDMIGLDRESSDNQVTMQVDREKGEVRLQTNSLAVSQLNVSGISIASARLENVQIVVKNAQVKLPLLGEVSVGSAEANAKKSATISIGSVTGINASYGEGDEAIKASRVALRNVRIESEMGGESFGMQPQNATFSVGEAKVVGLDSKELSGNMSLSDASASIDQTTESARFAAGSVLGSNLSRQGLAIENTSLLGLQGNIAAGGNRHVANVSARQATVSGLDIGEDIGKKNATDRDSGSNFDVNLSLNQATINDLDTKNVDAEQVALSNFQLSQSQNGLQTSASHASVNGLDTNQIDANSLDLTGAHFAMDSQGFNTGALNASAAGLDTKWGDADLLTLSNLNYSQNRSGLNVSATGGTASGIDTNTVDAQALQIGHTNINHNNETGTNIALKSANASGLTGPVNASSLSLRELNSNIGIDGSSSLNLDRVTARGLEGTQGSEGSEGSEGHSVGMVTASSIQANRAADGSASGSLEKLAYQDYQSNLGNSASGSIQNIQGSGNLNTLEGQASIGSVQVGESNILGNQIASASIQNIQGEKQNGLSAANISSFSAQGVQNEYASAGSITGKNISAQHDQQSNTFSGNLEQLQINAASSFGATADQVTMNNASGNADASLENAGFSIDNVNVKNGANDIGYLETLNLNGIKGEKEGQDLNASLAEFEMLNSGIVGVGATDSVKALGLSVQSNGTTHQANMDTMKVQNIRENNFGATVEEANLESVMLSGTGLSDLNAHIGSGDINNAAMQGASLERGSISDGNAQFKNGQGTASLGAIDFQNAAYLDLLSAESGQARDISVSGNLDEQQGSVSSVRLDGMKANMSQVRGSLNSAALQGAKFHHTGAGHGTASIDQIQAKKGQFELQDSVRTGQSFNKNAAPVNMNIDTKRLMQTGARRIDSANINASANMISGEYGEGFGGFGIKKDTQMNANLAIRNNRIQNGSQIGTNRPIDTALWTSTDGLYVKDNRMMADVNGWFDINASEKANGALGLKGKDLHSIDDYVTAATNIPSSGDSQSAMGNPIDMNSIRANGNLSLSDGQIDAGGASVQLAGANQGANQLAFQANASRISMAFAQLLSSSLAINTDQGNVHTGKTSIEGGEVALRPNKSTATGSVNRVSIESVNLSR